MLASKSASDIFPYAIFFKSISHLAVMSGFTCSWRRV